MNTLGFLDKPIQTIPIDPSDIPDLLPVMPLRSTVIYPRQVLPISVGRKKSLKLVEKAIEGDKIIGLATQLDGTIDEPNADQIYKFGVSAIILKVLKFLDTTQHIIFQGIKRL